MQAYRVLVLCLFSAGMPAQTQHTAAGDRALREARHRYMLVATKATALFDSMDAVSRSLAEDGSTIHPATGALRLRIESALHDADSALSERGLELATLETKLAEELVARLARRIGGES